MNSSYGYQGDEHCCAGYGPGGDSPPNGKAIIMAYGNDLQYQDPKGKEYEKNLVNNSAWKAKQSTQQAQRSKEHHGKGSESESA